MSSSSCSVPGPCCPPVGVACSGAQGPYAPMVLSVPGSVAGCTHDHGTISPTLSRAPSGFHKPSALRPEGPAQVSAAAALPCPGSSPGPAADVLCWRLGCIHSPCGIPCATWPRLDGSVASPAPRREAVRLGPTLAERREDSHRLPRLSPSPGRSPRCSTARTRPPPPPRPPPRPTSAASALAPALPGHMLPELSSPATFRILNTSSWDASNASLPADKSVSQYFCGLWLAMVLLLPPLPLPRLLPVPPPLPSPPLALSGVPLFALPPL
mmetsp:Transcript_14088/g.24668  ORF Transcript_14088/g.24668 Transcript_14088/m.24668 type:complete len:269 (+) Transcript_14088:2028-2834(+)